MVSYRDTDGKQCYHQTDELPDAVMFVEHLRNAEAVDSARIFKLEELSFEFRPYFRVELATELPPPPAPVTAPAPAPEAAASQPAGSEWLSAIAGNSGEDADPLAAAWSATEPAAGSDDGAVGAGMARKGLFGR